MVYSPLITGTSGYGAKSSPRNAAVDRFIVHHAADTSLQNVLATIAGGAREVSANYVVYEGQIIGVVPEERRAWTSGSSSDGGKGAAFDHRSITVETINSTGSPGWQISEATKNSLARLIADVGQRHGFPLVRAGAGSTVLGHRELYQYFAASYATACPGGIDMDEIVHRALSGTPKIKNTTPQEDKMLAIMSIKDEKGILRILMVDHGQCTFWDVSKGLRTPAQVTERIEWWKAQNIKSLGEQHPWLLDGYTDITNR